MPAINAARIPKVVVLALTLAALPGTAVGQTPAQQTAREKAFYDQLARFRKDAVAAFNREMDRQKAEACREAVTTVDIVNCLSKENDATEANYTAYFDALRSLLALTLGNDDDRTPGPTGVPLTAKEIVDELDVTEAAWQKYRQAQCKAAFDLYKGGTVASPQAGSCELMLVRNHMRELDSVYYGPLHN